MKAQEIFDKWEYKAATNTKKSIQELINRAGKVNFSSIALRDQKNSVDYTHHDDSYNIETVYEALAGLIVKPQAIRLHILFHDASTLLFAHDILGVKLIAYDKDQNTVTKTLSCIKLED